ncbi:MAG: hypothetical protein ACRDOK_02395 [Streptosporangiaceae bacterium]
MTYSQARATIRVACGWSLPASPASSAAAAPTAESDPRRGQPGYSPATCPDARSLRRVSANGCALGIYAQTGRRAALLSLAAQLPAAVLADLLGIHQTTAARWMHEAGGDWSSYAADLARTRPYQAR